MTEKLPSPESDEPASSEGESPATEIEGGQPDGVLASLGRMIAATGPVALPLRGLGHAFYALRHRDYRLLWIGSLLSNIGTWVQNVAKAWLVLKLSPPDSKEVWLGIDAFAGAVPTVILLPLGGVLADRLDRRWTLALTNALLGLAAAVLALLFYAELLEVWHIVAISAVVGSIAALTIPTNQSLLMQLVDHRDLPNAVALNSMQFNLSRAVGPAIGGVALVKLGATWSFSLNAASFLAVIAAVFLIAAPPPSQRMAETSVLHSIATGLRYLRARRDMIVIETLVFITGAAAAPAMIMLPRLVEALYGGHEPLLPSFGPAWLKHLTAAIDTGEQARYATLLSCFGVGAVLGAVGLAARARRGPLPWRAFPILLVFGLCELVLGLGVPFAAAMALTLLAGATFIGAMNRLFAALLSSTHETMRGRMSSLHVLFFSTGLPLGSLLAGGLGKAHGIRAVFIAFGIFPLVAVPAIFWLMRRAGVTYQADGHLRPPEQIHE